VPSRSGKLQSDRRAYARLGRVFVSAASSGCSLTSTTQVPLVLVPWFIIVVPIVQGHSYSGGEDQCWPIEEVEQGGVGPVSSCVEWQSGTRTCGTEYHVEAEGLEQVEVSLSKGIPAVDELRRR
jgi:hypothetical protein